MTADFLSMRIKVFGFKVQFPKTPIIVSSQINREVESEGREDRRPLLSHLEGSGKIEQLADIVLLLYRDSYYNKSPQDSPKNGEIIIAKGGPPITVPLKFYGDYLYWSEK